MRIGILNIELFLHETRSLKQKRFILNKMKDRLRRKFNISIVEAGYQDKWQRSVLGIVTASNNAKIINSTFDQILNSIEKSKDGFEILRDDFEIF